MIPSDVLFPPGATSRDWANDIAIATLATVASLGSVVWISGYSLASTFVLMISFAMTAPLAFRRHSPLLTLALCTVAGLLQVTFVSWPTLSLVSVPIVAYSVARWVEGSWSRLVLAIGGVGSVAGPLTWFNLHYPAGLTAYVLFWAACMGAVVAPYAIGRRMLELAESRVEREQSAEEKYQLLLAEREQQARLAEASTRAMIARELHDIVAHSLSVIIVQAEGSRAAASKRPEVAQEALDTIAETGREALHEMRRIVGVLRSGAGREHASYAPAPRLADLPDLVARTSDRARLTVHGTPDAVGPAFELTVYRIVQEALTNFLKHAGPDAHALVTVVYHPHQVTVDVVDDGHGVDDPTDGGGNGLRGMYERVTAMGGVLKAGTRPDAPGFRVTATLPTRPPSGPPRTTPDPPRPTPDPTGASR